MKTDLEYAFYTAARYGKTIMVYDRAHGQTRSIRPMENPCDDMIWHCRENAMDVVINVSMVEDEWDLLTIG